MQESVRKEQKKSQTLLTRPTSLEMLRTGIITTYRILRLMVRRGFPNIYPDQPSRAICKAPSFRLPD
jgi:hypothetical protein